MPRSHTRRRSARRRPNVAPLASLVAAFAVPCLASAQQLGWSGSAEANGSLLFGNARDRLIASRLQLARADSTLEVHADARFTYAEGTNDAGGRKVAGRTAFASLATDYRPFARYSPFWFGAVESSFQLRIARRYSTGAGAKLTFYRRKQDEASVSLALLAEHTRPRDLPPEADTVDTDWRARWSLRARMKHQVSESVRFSHVTFYQPSVDRVARYTISSTTTLSTDLTKTLALTFTLHETYDSESRARGARTNNDGQLLFGIRAGF